MAESAISRYGSALKRVAAVAVAVAVVVFFWRAFSRNWQSIRAQHFELNFSYLGLAFAGIAATSLLGTLAWHDSINALSPSKLIFRESVATVNASSLVKYIPGKLWTYALQMYWLAKRGIPKSLVLYVNIINIAVSLLTSSLLGLIYLLLGPERFPRTLLVGLFASLALLDLLCVRFNGLLFGWLLGLLNRLLKRQIERFDVPSRLMLRLHLIHTAAALVSGAAAWALCFGIGYRLAPAQALLVMASSLLSDVVGFLAVVSPGGLGVREGVMYAILGGAASGSIALVLPLAARAVSMLVDVALGGVALKLLKGLGK